MIERTHLVSSVLDRTPCSVEAIELPEVPYTVDLKRCEIVPAVRIVDGCRMYVGACRCRSRQDAVRPGRVRSKEKPRIITQLSGLALVGERYPMIGLFVAVTGRYVQVWVREWFMCGYVLPSQMNYARFMLLWSSSASVNGFFFA